MKKLYLFLLLIPVLLLQGELYSSNRGPANQQSKDAEKYFYAQQYDKAAPLFAQLISTDPQNFRYNYFYGICLLITSGDKPSSIPYLEKAASNENAPEDVYYYLARAYHFDYRFDDARKMYEEYQSYIGAKESSKLFVPDLIQMCKNGKELLDTSKSSAIAEKWTATPGDFFETYRFPEKAGKLLRMPDGLSDRSDVEPGEKPMVFLSANGRVIYFSRRSEVTNSFDLFRCEKNTDGQWDRPVRIDATVNSGKDEVYPTCNEDGRILYFSSRGHNTTGGYDIFKSYYNPVTRSWCKPENAGSPYNSPDDDFCFVSSKEKSEACFVSQRETPPGTYTVYRVSYSTSENLPYIINGKFKCMMKPATLPVFRLHVKKESPAGYELVSTTESTTEDYAVEFPEQGTYQLTAAADGFEPQTHTVIIDEKSELTTALDFRLESQITGMETKRKHRKRNSRQLKAEEIQVADKGDRFNAAGNKTVFGKDQSRRKRRNDNMRTETTPAPVAAVTEEKIVYKVQIGAFRNTPEHQVEKTLQDLTDRTMMTSYNDTDWLRYFMGEETSLESARNLNEILQEIGFKDAFIVGFKNGVPCQLSQLQAIPENVASGDDE